MDQASSFRSAFYGYIGVARADITPPVGIFSRQWGAATDDVATGVHRPLTATVLTLRAEPNAQPLILIALDFGVWRTVQDEWLLRGTLLTKLELDEGRLLVALSHTHAGPSICRADAGQPGGHLVLPYLDSMCDSVTNSVKVALATQQMGVLEWRYGRCDLASNRDLREPDRSRFICGFNPEAEADDTLLVGRATARDGQPIATIVNYACHPTTLAWQNQLISPDYVGAMREVTEDHTGVPCLFLQGASGDLAPREQYTGDILLADRHGASLGFAVLSCLAAMTPPHTELAFTGVVESGAPLAMWQAKSVAADAGSRRLEVVHNRVDLPLKPLAPIEEIERELATCTDHVSAERIRRRLEIRHTVGDGSTSSESLWVWRIGNAILVAQRNETYSIFQRQLREAHIQRPVAVLNLINGSVGYLPPAELYKEDLYSVWQTPYAKGSLEKLLDFSKKTVRSLLNDEV